MNKMQHLTVTPSNLEQRRNGPGSFVAIEGIDGSGTTTVVRALEEKLNVVTTKEPAEQHWTGQAARRAINDDDTHPLTDLFFFLGDRAYHLKNTVKPALADGETVVTDRYLLSTLAYQQENLSGVVDSPKLFIHQSMWEWVRYPNLTILLDLPVEEALERSSGDDKYEVSDFQQVVRQNYLNLAKQNDDIVTVDATQPVDDVVADVIVELGVVGALAP